MPSKSWVVAIQHGDESLEFKEEAFTEDGAMSHASMDYKERVGRWPHEEEFQKVECLTPTTDSTNSATA